jgi:hypothetical protein
MVSISGCAQNPPLSHTDDTVNTQQTTTRRTGTAEPQQQASRTTTPAKPSAARKPHKSNKKTQPTKPVIKAAKPATVTARINHPSITLNSPFKLKYGQKRSLPNSELNFKISKVNDSRCPLEMQCVQQGNAAVTLTLYRNEKRIDRVNLSGDSDVPLIKDRQYAYYFQLLELQPYPTVQFIEPQHYVAELIITQSSLK